MLARALRCTRTEWRLVCEALAAIVVARVGLACMPFDRLRHLFEGVAPSRRRSGSAREARWAVDAVAARIPGTRCLPRALALQAMLRRRAIDAELRIGVARADDGAFAAHAWVETAEADPASQAQAGRFAALPALPR